MSSSAALIAVLAFAGNALAAPAANDRRFNLNPNPSPSPTYDDGQYHWKPATKVVDASYSDFPTVSPISDTYGYPASGIESGYPYSEAPEPTFISTLKPGKPTTTKRPTFATFKPETTTAVVIKTTQTTKEAPGPTGETGPAASKKEFKGDGTPAQGWPAVDKWISFEALWSANEKAIKSSCTNGIPQNSETENKNLKAAIQSEGKANGVDPRFILAVVLQESHGCVRVEHTRSPGDLIHNPGLMQSHAGTEDCEKFGAKECTNDKIVGMIHEGAVHTASKDGSGLKTGLDTAKANGSKGDAQSAYWSARLYNSGDYSYEAGGDLSSTVKAATASYSSDIANRLVGVVF